MAGFDVPDLYEVVDDILVFGGIALIFFGQLWGIALVLLGFGIMYLKGEISFGGKKKELSQEEEEYLQYTGGEGKEEEAS